MGRNDLINNPDQVRSLINKQIFVGHLLQVTCLGDGETLTVGTRSLPAGSPGLSRTTRSPPSWATDVTSHAAPRENAASLVACSPAGPRPLHRAGTCQIPPAVVTPSGSESWHVTAVRFVCVDYVGDLTRC